MKMLITAGMMLALGACAYTPPVPYTLTNQFNADDVSWAKDKGNNTIKASALLRQAGGAVITCAGNPITLIPAGKYSDERMALRYGSTQRGYWQPNGYSDRSLPEAPAGYNDSTKEKICDPQGFATFTDLVDGSYYVTTNVQWGVPQGSGAFSYMAQQGGALMQRVVVKNGETVDAVLTN